MNVLVTAGNTLVPIDRVRCITNIFTGRTGAAIALKAHERGHSVRLLTSHPEAVEHMQPDAGVLGERWTQERYRTFEDLQQSMAEAIQRGGLDGVIHCAAVSDYLAYGIYSPAPGVSFDPDPQHPGDLRIHQTRAAGPVLTNRLAGKVKSDEPELWLRLRRAPKLVDRIRTDWGFRGLLVKFKLEVGVDDERLLEIAERSRQHSAADLMVANTLECSSQYAYLGPLAEGYKKVGRLALAEELLLVLERLHREGRHG